MSELLAPRSNGGIWFFCWDRIVKGPVCKIQVEGICWQKLIMKES